MILTGVVRIGRDVELRHTASGQAVAGISGVYEYGRKEGDRRPSQWVDLTLWGKQAEGMAQYLTKGTVINVTADDVHIEEYQSAKGTGTKLAGKVVTISFVPRQAERTEQTIAPRQAAVVDDSEIPF